MFLSRDENGNQMMRTHVEEEQKESLLQSGSAQDSLGFPVFVHVYDLLYDVNQYLYPIGLGMYHSSVEVHGKEYAFGGHAYDMTGVFSSSTPGRPPTFSQQQHQQQQGAVGIRHRERILIGYTLSTQREVEETIALMGTTAFRGNQYHLLQMNCNTFTSEVVQRLTGKQVPGWINRIASIAVALHCLLPSHLVPPLLEEQGRRAAQQTLSSPSSSQYAS